MWANSLLFRLLNILIAFRLSLGFTETSDLEDTESFTLDKRLFYKTKITGSPTNKVDVHGNAQYGYDGGPGTSDWNGACASGFAQSPITFEPETVVPVLRRILRFSGHTQIPLSTNITNSGHSVKVKLRTLKPITLTGGVLGDVVYEFQQLHFHWGNEKNQGSEHKIGRKSYPLEVHFVFYKSNVKDPTNEENGIVVLGNVYEVGKDNRPLDVITKNAQFILQPGSFVLRPGGPSLSSYLPTDLNSYFNYKGSLTTPPCTEGVLWIWFPQKQTISSQQLQELQNIKDELGLKVVYNYRETQPLNQRAVFLVKSTPQIVL